MSCNFIRHNFFVWIAFGCLSTMPAQAADEAILTVHADQSGPMISRHIFGQFAEQLGSGIYGGIWVGENSSIPNVRGIRSDVVAALRELKVPNVRWPGGCFADEYYWRNGIGPIDQRRASYNKNWGDVFEPNTFGTHEFMDFVEQIGSEAYISVNVGTGSAREAGEWLEYMTADQPTALVNERIANGREKPFKVKFLGIGNESWGCGGALSAEAYVERMKTFAMVARNLDPEQSGASRFIPGPDPMQRIAVGPGDHNPEYTEAVMRAWKGGGAYSWSIEGLSLHHYTSGELGAMRDPATGFGEHQYAILIKNAYQIDKFIADNAEVMDRYDPDKKVGLVVDEWGVWLSAMPGTSPLHLKQQNSLRDAIAASIHLNIFARHSDRVRMANIAQMVNVLQAMIITDNERMVITPTYQVFKMYQPFQDARLVPVDLIAREYREGDTTMPSLDAIAARDADGKLWMALTNLDPNRSLRVETRSFGVDAKTARGHVLTADRVDAVNSFESPNVVVPNSVEVGAVQGRLILDLPSKSITVVSVEE